MFLSQIRKIEEKGQRNQPQGGVAISSTPLFSNAVAGKLEEKISLEKDKRTSPFSNIIGERISAYNYDT